MIDLTQEEITRNWGVDNSDNPLISIKCMTYNHENYIAHCIDGFLMQKTNFPFEILIHDDCSTDKTESIVRDYETKFPKIIKGIYETENQWQKGCGAHHTKIDAAIKGKYIALCEGDDYWIDENKLQMQVDFLEKNPDFGLCYTKCLEYNQSKNEYTPIILGRKIKDFNDLLSANGIPTLTVLVRSELVQSYAVDINPSNKNWKMGDYPLWLYISKKSKIKHFETVSGVYRILENSASHSNDINKLIDFEKSVFEIQSYFSKRFNGNYYPNMNDKFISLFNSQLLNSSKKNRKCILKNLKIILQNFPGPKPIKIIIKYFLYKFFPFLLKKHIPIPIPPVSSSIFNDDVTSKHAYLILAHNEAKLLSNLISLLDDPRNDIYIHIDKKSKSLRNFKYETKHSRIKIIRTNKIYWGSYSIVNAELDLYEAANKFSKYQYYHLLSGVDLPLHNQDYIHKFCNNLNGKDLLSISFSDNNLSDAEMKNKINYYFLFTLRANRYLKKIGIILRRITAYYQKIIKLKQTYNITNLKGHEWCSLSNMSVEFLLKNRKLIKKLYSKSLCPDEIYKQTFLYHFNRNNLYTTCDESNITVLTAMRAIDWNRGFPYTWKMIDKEELENSCALFARKFSSEDTNIIECIKKNIQAEIVKDY